MAPYLWAPLAVVLVAIIGWAASVQRQLGSRMTRAEHEKLCTEKHQATTKQLDRIEEALDTHIERTAEHRHAMSEAVAHIETRLSVIEDRSHRRREGDRV